MASIFTRIIQGEIPSYKIYEDDYCFCFLDISPLAKGHVLVVPKNEVDYIFDLPDDIYNALWAAAKHVAKAIESAIPCKRIGIAVIGLEVPHVHIHLLPLQSVEDINFSKPKLSLNETELTTIAAKITAAL